MSQLNKKLKAMQDNPHNNWHIEDLKSLAKRFNIEYRQKGSHVHFFNKGGVLLTIPARNPLKAHYVKEFVKNIESTFKN